MYTPNELQKAIEHFRQYIDNDCYTEFHQNTCRIAVAVMEEKLAQLILRELLGN